MLNVVDGCIPSSRAETVAEIEEERRLLYVAMTRAKDELVLMTPRQAGIRQAASFGVTAVRSQFIPTGALERFEQVSWSRHADEPARNDSLVAYRILGHERPAATRSVAL